MENRGLLFIPDISGFTRFVNQTEIDHGRLIIQELLEILINANQMDLEISEIEGDAILFYKFGDCPQVKEIYSQVERMFCDFHRSLAAYDLHKFCQCKACTSAIDLTLKVITHYGEFTGFSVKQFNKLFGKDVIIIHQLLKNDIDIHEYWLATYNLTHEPPSGLTDWMHWKRSSKQTDSGEVLFHYTQLGRLKELIPPETGKDLELSSKAKMFTLTRDFNADIIRLFHATGDFRYRNRWQVGVENVEEISHYLPRVGMKRKSIGKDGSERVYASSYSFHPDKIQFSETEENKKYAIYFTLEKIDYGRSRLTLEYYVPKAGANHLLFNLFNKKRQENIFRKSLENLEAVLREIRLPADPA
jgi:hypothetical protein